MPVEPAQQLLQFMKGRAAQLRASDTLPATLEEWQSRKQQLRQNLLKSWGGFPAEPCDLAPKIVGELKRDGYRVEKVLLQTRPGIWMTANAYIPDGEGKRAAVLNVHGHWKGAKQDPVVQSRCIGLAKLGFFVLAVDAFGAGERGLSKNLGEYHGEMVAATLLPVGLPLSGLQVYENMRAVDYLLTRPEVDGSRLGITGASGGGNQTMYAGAFDERFRAVVPVCSVGTYQSYIGAASCMCEVVPNALTYTEESGLLSLVAPRALMVINATKDAFQFSVGEAQKSIAVAQPIFRMYGKAGSISHDIFESPHDYGKAMRESMYGWMTLHLKGEGLGNPIPEPAFQTEDPEDLRCFSGDTRPDDFVTLPKFAAAEGRKLNARWDNDKLAHREHWDATAERLQHAFTSSVLGGWPQRTESKLQVSKPAGSDQTVYTAESEPGIEVTATHFAGTRKEGRLAIILDLEGAAHAEANPVVKGLAEQGWDRLVIDVRGSGKYAVAGDKIMRAPDHNSCEWSLWTGRPLLGQWIWDARRIIDAVTEVHPELLAKPTLIGIGSAGVIALGTAIYTRKIANVVLVDTLASYVSDQPYEHQWMGIMVPRILREVGDIPQLAAMVAPRKLVIVGGVDGSGTAVKSDALEQNFAYSRKIYGLLEAEAQLTLANPEAAVKLLNG
ncbi:MAG: dienelactone hydrolase-like enzyme [Planctomycetaceae bacterium]|nr:dienelactone hydrolase-like enzyme [Planctomycetaceae bacterium]